MKTVRLPDGYNGHSTLFFAEPIQRDGNLVKLRCAEPGKEYMTAWKHESPVEQAFIAELESRSMSSWTDEELVRYSRITGQN